MKACLKTCCCCCALKTGVLIIGSTFLVVFIIFFLKDSLGYSILPPERNHNVGAVINKDDDNQFFGTTLVILSSSIEIITSSLLIVGAKEGIAKLLIPWIVTSCFSIVGGTIFEIVSLFLEDISCEFSLIFILWVGVLIYFIMVVNSHYEELKASHPEEPMNLSRYRSPPINPPDENISFIA